MTAWRLSHDGDVTELMARSVPDRWDVRVEVVLQDLPVGSRVRTRLAHQVRQDVWRAAQRVRGFVPRILIAQSCAETRLTAGGVIVRGHAVPPGLTDTLAGILDNGMNRRRWLRFAARAGRGAEPCSTRS